MLAFCDKLAGERLDYTIDLDAWLIDGREISSAVASIVGASNGESPFALQFYDSPSVTLSTAGDTSPAITDYATVHLSGGTAGTTYYIKFTFTDDSGTPSKIGQRFLSIRVVGQDSGSNLLVVEDGTLVSGANSYVTVAEADAYFEKRGDTVWLNADFIEKANALVKGMDYLTQKYRHKWRGSRVSAAQAADWPRRGVPIEDFFDPFFREINVPLQFQNTAYVAENTVPAEVKVAQFLLARSTLTSAGVSSVSLQADVSRPIKSAKVGPLEVEYAGSEDLSSANQLTTTYWDVEQTIRIYLKPSGGLMGHLERA